jgi:hypothetical protein
LPTKAVAAVLPFDVSAGRMTITTGPGPHAGLKVQVIYDSFMVEPVAGELAAMGVGTLAMLLKQPETDLRDPSIPRRGLFAKVAGTSLPAEARLVEKWDRAVAGDADLLARAAETLKVRFLIRGKCGTAFGPSSEIHLWDAKEGRDVVLNDHRHDYLKELAYRENAIEEMIRRGDHPASVFEAERKALVQEAYRRVALAAAKAMKEAGVEVKAPTKPDRWMPPKTVPPGEERKGEEADIGASEEGLKSTFEEMKKELGIE